MSFPAGNKKRQSFNELLIRQDMRPIMKINNFEKNKSLLRKF